MKPSLSFLVSMAMLILATVVTTTGSAAVTLTEKGGRFLLENDFVSLSVDPAKGGKIDSYRVKATNHQLLGRDCFLIGDHFWQQMWPGEFLEAPYEARIVEAGGNSATLEVSCTSKGWQGSNSQNGLRIARRMTLEADSPALKVEIGITNTGKAGRLAGYWNQSVFYASGDKEERQLYFRPCIRGISKATYLNSANEKTAENAGTDGFVRDVQNGWMAIVGEKTEEGLAFVMRYDELMFLYNCLGGFTSEWQYKAAAIPSGKTWKTDFIVYPLHGLARVDHASRNLAAAVEAKDDAGKVKVTLSLVAAGKPLDEVSVSGEIAKVRETGHPTTPFLPQKLGQIGGRPMPIQFELPHEASDPLAIRFKIVGKVDGRPVEESFEVWYGANYGRNWQVDLSPLYPIPVPERHVTFLKPDKIEKARNPFPRVLLCRGPYVDDYLPASIFKALKAEVVPSRMSYSTIWPSSLDFFPTSYEELMVLDIIALINVDTVALGDFGQEMIKDFVTHGGTLVYGGDHWAYGRGHLSGGSLADLLPVTFDPKGGTAALQYTPGQRVMRVANGQEAGALAPDGVLLYSGGKYQIRKGARVLLQTGRDAAVLVEWKVGKGRVIAITGTVLGEPPAGQALFTRTAEWSVFTAELLKASPATEP